MVLDDHFPALLDFIPGCCFYGRLKANVWYQLVSRILISVLVNALDAEVNDKLFCYIPKVGLNLWSQ